MPRKTKKDEVAELRAQVAELLAALKTHTEPAVEVVPVLDPDEAPGLCLDLACGESCREGYEGVDAFEVPGVKHVFDLTSGERWPFEDGSVDALHCSHFIEHIEAGNKHTTYSGQGNLFYFFFQEAFRVLKPGGTFTVVWPALQNVRAFMDPTHTRYIPREMLMYLDEEWRKANKLDHYSARGIPLNFKTVSAHPSIPEIEAAKPDVVQMQNANDHWNFFQDWCVTLNKPE